MVILLYEIISHWETLVLTVGLTAPGNVKINGQEKITKHIFSRSPTMYSFRETAACTAYWNTLYKYEKQDNCRFKYIFFKYLYRKCPNWKITILWFGLQVPLNKNNIFYYIITVCEAFCMFSHKQKLILRVLGRFKTCAYHIEWMMNMLSLWGWYELYFIEAILITHKINLTCKTVIVQANFGQSSFNFWHNLVWSVRK